MKGFVFIFVMLLTNFSFGHAYYFAFAEMQFNEESSRFEISIRATGHDVEDYMKHIGQDVGQLEKANSNPVAKKQLETMLQQHFVITVNNQPIILDLVGVEINAKDEAIFYLTSRKMKQPKRIEITFDLLMNLFEEQQNKITVFTPEGKKYLSFLPHKTKRIFEFIES